LAISPQSNPTPKPVPQETEDDDEVEDDEVEEEEDVPVVETPNKPKKVAQKPSQDVPDEAKEQALMQEQAQKVMMLQDNGIFRSELLGQLNQISRALTIIANIGIELTKPDDK